MPLPRLKRSPQISVPPTALIVFSSIGFGLVPLFARQLLEQGLSAEVIAFYRFGFSALFTLPFLPRSRDKIWQALLLFGAGIFMAFGWIGYIRAIEIVPLATAGVLYMTYPLFVLVLARFLVGQRITVKALLAGTLVIGAAASALAPGSVTPAQLSALLPCLSAPVSFALVVVVLSSMVPRLTAPERLSCGMLGAVVGLAPALMTAEVIVLLPATVDGWYSIAAMAILTATLPQILYTVATPRVGPTRSAVAGAAELPTMMAIGWLAFGETIGGAEMAGGLLILIAIVIAPKIDAISHTAAPIFRRTGQAARSPATP